MISAEKLMTFLSDNQFRIGYAMGVLEMHENQADTDASDMLGKMAKELDNLCLEILAEAPREGQKSPDEEIPTN